MIYGYARVSSTDQNEARQIDALQKANVDKIYVARMVGWVAECLKMTVRP